MSDCTRFAGVDSNRWSVSRSCASVSEPRPRNSVSRGIPNAGHRLPCDGPHRSLLHDADPMRVPSLSSTMSDPSLSARCPSRSNAVQRPPSARAGSCGVPSRLWAPTARGVGCHRGHPWAIDRPESRDSLVGSRCGTGSPQCRSVSATGMVPRRGAAIRERRLASSRIAPGASVSTGSEDSVRRPWTNKPALVAPTRLTIGGGTE